jgi:hypothetical protein
MIPTRSSSDLSIGYVLSAGAENNPGTTEEAPGPTRISNDPNLDLPSSSWYQPSERFSQPVAGLLDLTFGDFPSMSDDMDNMNEFSFDTESSISIPPSQEESFEERDVHSSGDGEIVGGWDLCDDELDFPFEIPGHKQPD